MKSGIGQGHSMSPLMFNINNNADKTNKRIPNGGVKEIYIVCYADDAVSFAETEFDLQRSLHVINRTQGKRST